MAGRALSQYLTATLTYRDPGDPSREPITRVFALPSRSAYTYLFATLGNPITDAPGYVCCSVSFAEAPELKSPSWDETWREIHKELGG